MTWDREDMATKASIAIDSVTLDFECLPKLTLKGRIWVDCFAEKSRIKNDNGVYKTEFEQTIGLDSEIGKELQALIIKLVKQEEFN